MACRGEAKEQEADFVQHCADTVRDMQLKSCTSPPLSPVSQQHHTTTTITTITHSTTCVTCAVGLGWLSKLVAGMPLPCTSALLAGLYQA